jgi:hypothetical protein
MSEQFIGKFRCRDNQMTRIKDEHPDSHLVPERESGGPKYDPLVMTDENEMPEPVSQIPMGDDETDPPMAPAGDEEESVKAEERRQSEMDAFVAASDRKNGRRSAPTRDELATMSPIERFAAWSDFRRRR